MATELAGEDPLPSAGRCLERLRAVAAPEGVAALEDARLVQMAAAASREAAVNGRGEIYPVGLAPRRALAVMASALSDGGTVAQVEERVRSRFSEAAPLPARPGLDALLREAAWRWCGTASATPRRAAGPRPSSATTPDPEPRR